MAHRRQELPPGGRAALNRLHDALDHFTPLLIRQLVRVHQDLTEAIEQHTLERDLALGIIPLDLLDRLQQTARRSIQTHVLPLLQAIAHASLVSPRLNQALLRQADNLARAFATAIAATIRDTIAIGIAQLRPIAEVVRELLDLVGLNRQQARAVQRFRLRAPDRAASMIDRLQADRLQTMATTELATAFNLGALLTPPTRPVQRIGIWRTAEDELVCDVCWARDGSRVPDDGSRLPPEHPNCRCVVDYLILPA
jgi:Phage Mu protein F like protein